MKTPWEVLFWLGAACVVYTYVLYPLVLAAAARLRPWPVRREGPGPRSVSIILAARDEAAVIARRVRELCRLLGDCGLPGELIVVSDGSSDDTVARAQAVAADDVRVLELPGNQGKALALTAGAAAAAGEVLVFADARQTWAPDTLRRLLENFADPSVGAVSGDLVVESAPGVMAGVGLYWRFEKWLRRAESRVHSMVGVTGAVCAVRRELFRPIPAGTVLDDVYWPLQVALQGYRVVHDSRACAFDRLPERARDEFRRKVRTLSGNFQLLTRLPAALLPGKNPIWGQYVSHKLLRLAVPWALLAMLLASAALTAPLFAFALRMQLLFYGLALVGLWKPFGAQVRLGSAAASFLVLNSAAWLAFWVWVSGRAGQSWTKVPYAAPAGTPAVPADQQAAGMAVEMR